MAPPRQRTAAIVDDSRSEASSGTREFKTSAPRSRKTGTAAKDKASVTSTPIAAEQPIEEQPRVRIALNKLYRGKGEKSRRAANQRRQKREEERAVNSSESISLTYPPVLSTGPLVRSPTGHPPRLPPRPQTPHPLRLLNRLLPPHPLPRRRPALPNSPRSSPRPVNPLIHTRAQRYNHARRRVLLLAAPHRRPRPRKQGSIRAGRSQTL